MALYIYDMVYNGAVLAEEAFHEIQITSHRGSSWEAPENTIPAIKLAVENLADFVEIDVQETKDGQVVLLHDNSLNRTTGIKQSIWNVTYDPVSYTHLDVYKRQSSYSAMFVRIAMGTVNTWEIIVSFVILVASIFGAGILGAKIYRMGTLRYGNPIKLTVALKDLKKSE